MLHYEVKSGDDIGDEPSAGAVQHTNRYDRGRLRYAVRRAGESTGDVRTVPVAV
jgi:hypothetical protein